VLAHVDRHHRRAPGPRADRRRLLTKHQSRAAARSLLEAEADARPAFWAELSGLGLLGLHVPEELGGSGFGLAETLVVAEEMGRHLAPGPFVPTVITSAVLVAAGPDELRKRVLPGLADGSVIGAAALGGDVRLHRRCRDREGRRRAQRSPGGRAAGPRG
jgi:alkylation response protein AidB-like acyl-CoA dehydrogenase